MWHNLNAISSNVDNSTSWSKKDVFHARVFILYNKIYERQKDIANISCTILKSLNHKHT